MSENNKKEIELINGDGTNLVISPVYEHIPAAKPTTNNNRPKNIIIPGEKKQITQKKEPEQITPDTTDKPTNSQEEKNEN